MFAGYQQHHATAVQLHQQMQLQMQTQPHVGQQMPATHLEEYGVQLGRLQALEEMRQQAAGDGGTAKQLRKMEAQMRACETQLAGHKEMVHTMITAALDSHRGEVNKDLVFLQQQMNSHYAALGQRVSVLEDTSSVHGNKIAGLEANAELQKGEAKEIWRAIRDLTPAGKRASQDPLASPIIVDKRILSPKSQSELNRVKLSDYLLSNEKDDDMGC